MDGQTGAGTEANFTRFETTMNTDHPTAYPLQWPMDQKRTPAYQRERGTFKGSLAGATSHLVMEVDRLVHGRVTRYHSTLILSTNLQVRLDGFPRSGQKEPDDPGVAAHFKDKNGRLMCLACDRYDKVWKNVVAITKTIEALRGIERWGSKQMFDRAFTGFAALPMHGTHTGSSWRGALKITAANPTLDEVKDSYKRIVRELYYNGDDKDETLRYLHEAMEMAKKELS